MPARLLVVAAAVAAIAFGAVHLHRDHQCGAAHYALVYALVGHHAPPGGIDAQIATLKATCDDPVALEGISILLTASGRPQRAVALARLAIRRDPRAQAGWIALAQALDRSDPAGAARARARVTALDPLGVVARAPTHVGLR